MPYLNLPYLTLHCITLTLPYQTLAELTLAYLTSSCIRPTIRPWKVQEVRRATGRVKEPQGGRKDEGKGKEGKMERWVVGKNERKY